MLDNGIQRKTEPVLNGNETILVVDDCEEVRNFLNAALAKFGYRVICADDGMDGLKKYTENKGKIHVMLIDVFMPKLNGMDLFKEINKLEPNIKVLFMSGYNELFDRNNQQAEMRCIKYISKPFRINTLLKELRDVLDNSGYVS